MQQQLLQNRCLRVSRASTRMLVNLLRIKHGSTLAASWTVHAISITIGSRLII